MGIKRRGRKQDRNFVQKSLRTAGEASVAQLDGTVAGLFGQGFMGDDFYDTKLGQGMHDFTKVAAPATLKAIAAAKGGPMASKAVGTLLDHTKGEEESSMVDDLSGNTFVDQMMGMDGLDLSQIPAFEHGGMSESPLPMYNIERGELIVDPETGDIVKELDSKQYKSHSKNPKKEDPNNFLQIEDGLVIIPKKDAENYKKNPTLRKGIIRNVVNLYKEREQFGRDSNGNVKKYAELYPQAKDGLETGKRNRTTGDLIGDFGTAIGAIGPLMTTMQMGIDTQEPNVFDGVSRRAEGLYGRAMGRGRDQALKTLRANTQLGLQTARDGSRNFSTMSGRKQNMLNDLNQNVEKVMSSYDTQLATGLSGLAMQGESLAAQGRDKQIERQKMNRAAYYTNINRDLSNIGAGAQSFGRNQNVSHRNERLLQLLKDYSPDYTFDTDGNLVFRKKEE